MTFPDRLSNDPRSPYFDAEVLKRDVAILKIEPVGNYAVRITFDDFHDTGIFTWNYLHTLGHEMDSRWQGYLDELSEKGLSRDR